MNDSRETAHVCHAEGCGRACPPRHLMCPGHWATVPAELRRLVWESFRPGQEDDSLTAPRSNPSRAWLKAARLAIAAVAYHDIRQAQRAAEGKASDGRSNPWAPPLAHPCADLHCDEEGAFGFGVSLRQGRLGVWYCARHRDQGRAVGALTPAGDGPAPPQASARHEQGTLL